MLKSMQLLVLCATFLAFPLSSFAQEEITPIEDCELDDYGEICIDNGLYGTCGEQGPNGCNGENPDYPGDCRGYPYCRVEFCGVDDEPGDPCGIDGIAGDCRLRCDMTGEDCEDDEPTVCDISSALEPDDNADQSDDGGGCATTGQQGPAAFLLVGIVLAGLLTRRQWADSLR